MIKPARFNEKQSAINELVHRIKSGLLADGHPLPGEEQLSQELQVSTGTLRAALAELERRRYIAMQTEGGAIVTYDGFTLDQSNGWTQALADTGARIYTEILRLEAVERPELALQFGISHFVILERRRRQEDGIAISLERSLMPATGGLEGQKIMTPGTSNAMICKVLWTKFKDISLSHCQKIYEQLNVKLTMAHVLAVEIDAILEEDRAFNTEWYEAALRALPTLPPEKD